MDRPRARKFPGSAGAHAIGWLRGGLSDRCAARAAAEHGVESRPFSAYCLTRARGSGLVLGYGCFRPAEIRSGIEKLAAALRSCAS